MIVYTSDSSPLMADWITNGGGLKVSPQFGFGAIDAEAYVNRARYWKPVEKAEEIHQDIFNRSNAACQPYWAAVRYSIL